MGGRGRLGGFGREFFPETSPIIPASVQFRLYLQNPMPLRLFFRGDQDGEMLQAPRDRDFQERSGQEQPALHAASGSFRLPARDL